LFSAAHNSLPLVANWLKHSTNKHEKTLFVLYQLGLIFHYEKKVKLYSFPFIKYKDKSNRKLLDLLYLYCKKRKIKYVVVENYARPYDNPVKAGFQPYLMREENYKRYFRLIRLIVYKHIVFGKILLLRKHKKKSLNKHSKSN
jgi:hypothetical protein